MNVVLQESVLVAIVMACREEILKVPYEKWLKDPDSYHHIRLSDTTILKYAGCCRQTIRDACDWLSLRDIISKQVDGGTSIYDIHLPVTKVEILFHSALKARQIFWPLTGIHVYCSTKKTDAIGPSRDL